MFWLMRNLAGTVKQFGMMAEINQLNQVLKQMGHCSFCGGLNYVMLTSHIEAPLLRVSGPGAPMMRLATRSVSRPSNRLSYPSGESFSVFSGEDILRHWNEIASHISLRKLILFRERFSETMQNQRRKINSDRNSNKLILLLSISPLRT